VRGRVQGVGFRAFALRQAQARRCNGFVRNGPDGSTVAVVAEGVRESLEDLLEALWRGPRLSHVSGIDVQWLPATEEFVGFNVRY